MGLGRPQDVPHVDGAEVGEADQLPGGAVDVGAAVEDQHRSVGGGKQGGNRGPLDPVVQPEQDGGGGQHGAGIAGGDESVGAAGLLQAETDHDAGIGFPADGGEGLFRHADDFGGLVQLYAVPVGLRMLASSGLDDIRTPHQLDDEFPGKSVRASTTPAISACGARVAPHSVHRDANHPQASSTSTCFLPR